MTMFQYIGKNLDRIKYEIKLGIIPASVLGHYHIYSRYDYYRVQGINKPNAVEWTSLDLKITERWVMCIVNKMESEI